MEEGRMEGRKEAGTKIAFKFYLWRFLENKISHVNGLSQTYILGSQKPNL
jgi:hypothetical protein